MNVILTRYLYFLDECLYSLLMALINKNSFHENPFEEVAFWAGEIYYSGFEKELWEYIWKFYYDFYAIKYPKFEKKINKLSKNDEYNENKRFENIMYVINLLYYSNISYDVFIARMVNVILPNYIYKKTKMSYIKNMKIKMSKNEIFLIRSINDQKWQNIIYYIDKIGDMDRCYKLIKIYFENTYNYELKNADLNKINYENKRHIVIALIHHLLLDKSHIQHRRILRKQDMEMVQNEIKFNKKNITPLFHTLKSQRQFGISPLIGIFDLSRYKEKVDYKDILRLYWDYFAYHSPLWRERIDKCDGISVKKGDSYELSFKSDEDFDAFYEQYNYEPDEQPKDVQDMSICEIDENIGKSWLNDILDISKYHWISSMKLKTIY